MNSITTIIAVICSTFAADTNDSPKPLVNPQTPESQVIQIPAPDTALMQGYERYLENGLEFSPTRDA